MHSLYKELILIFKENAFLKIKLIRLVKEKKKFLNKSLLERPQSACAMSIKFTSLAASYF